MSNHPLNGTPKLTHDPIAIVGIGCRFPGGIHDPNTLWQLLYNEATVVSNIPANRFEVDALYDPNPATPGKIITRRGGFLENVDGFDAAFFGISPREVDYMDPQQRLLLEVTWEALENGGQVPAKLAGSQTGVFIGIWTNDYEDRMYQAFGDNINLYVTTGGGRYSAAGRLSYFFDFRGPSLTVDTACSSSLVAVHLACQSLHNGESDFAIAGGVNMILAPQITLGYSLSEMLSPDGRCKFGDAGADGYVRSEGAGVVFLKPLSRALADNDPIYAVIRGSAVNNDGSSSSFLVAPGVETQRALLNEAYHNAGISLENVDYIEAHGTGTKVGDRVELEALGKALNDSGTIGRSCGVGSIKTNIGHTESAAGIAGLIKVALALKHRTIPASLNYHQPNPHIAWSELPIHIQDKRQTWPVKSAAALAGVSSFGITGTNAHIVLQEQLQPTNGHHNGTHPTSAARLIPLSAHTAVALQDLARQYRQLSPQPTLSDLGYTAAVRRTHHAHRLALVCQTPDELMAQLDDFLNGALPRSSDTPIPQSAGKVVFVFPGQGSQWIGMGRELMAREPIFKEALTVCDKAIKPYTDWSLLEVLASDAKLEQIDVIQPCLFAIEVALAALWRSWGIEPQAVVGHSMGEVAAAHVAGVLTLADAAKIICSRSLLLKRVSGQGAMMLVELSLAEAKKLIAGHETKVSLAVSNGPTSTVLSGDTTALEAITQTLEAQSVFYRSIKVNVASHSPQMDPLKEDLLQVLTGIKPQPAQIPIYSTVVDDARFDEAYWVDNLREPVLFGRAIQKLLADEHTIFMEMSPHPILLPSIEEGLAHAGQAGTVLPSLRRQKPEQATLLETLGQLYQLGQPLDWSALYPTGHCITLPTYPWQHERFWFESDDTTPANGRSSARRYREMGQHPFLGQHIQSAAQPDKHLWQFELDLAAFPYLNHHRVRNAVVLPAAAYVEMVLAAAAETFPSVTHTLENVTFQETLFLAEDQPRLVQIVLSQTTVELVTFKLFSRQQTDPMAPWSLHAAGHLHLTTGETTILHYAAPDKIIARYPDKQTGTAHYQAMQQRDLYYGRDFQGVQQLWQGHGDALGQVTLSPEIRPDANLYRLHPALLDASFQVLMAALATASPAVAPDATYVPVRFDSVRLYQSPRTETLWSHARLQPSKTADSDQMTGDIYLFDENGRLVLETKGMCLQRITHDAQAIADNWLYQLQWQPQPLATPTPTTEAGYWLIFTDKSGLGRQLEPSLTQNGQRCVFVSWDKAGYHCPQPGTYHIDPTNPAHFLRLLQEVDASQSPVLHGIIHLWSLDIPPTDLEAAKSLGCLSLLYLIQALGTAGWTQLPRLLAVTRGVHALETHAQPLAVAQSPLWGLVQTLTQEHPEFNSKVVDVSPTATATEGEQLIQELAPSDPENYVVLRAANRYVARLAQTDLPTAVSHPHTPAATVQSAADQTAPFHLEISTPGLLETLAYRVTPPFTLQPHQVGIQVHAAGLNFKDVLTALGAFPDLPADSPIGLECAGIITAVGTEVEGFAVGDAVIAIAYHSFANQVVTDAHLVVKKPTHLSFEEAATIPVTFLTAYYALCYQGRLAQGERVLIHAAAGGVGLAAVQIAQHIGAEIFATAGRPDKQALLREQGVPHVMHSRSLDFADEIMDQTDGTGVDVVLNSLAGEFLSKSLSILGKYGRFLEIGRRDIYEDNQLGLYPFHQNLSFFAIDLDRMFRERPALVGSLFREIMGHFETHTFKPLPLKVFPAAHVTDAFQYVAQAKHIGKVVIAMHEAQVPVIPLASTRFSANATYLITGGMGGLGLSVAHWLIQEGAQHLVLLGRSAPSPTVNTLITTFQEQGAQVRTAQADVSQADQVARVMAEIEQTMPPLRGVIHAAGVLNDSTLQQLTRQQFDHVTAPKIDGAWNLHQQTAAKDLDFFWLFSSSASLLGNAGQGNYVAANQFLDSLAHYRQAHGLPALSINWGPWSEVGLAAAAANRGQRLAAEGMGSISPEEGTTILKQLLPANVPQIGVMKFNLPQWIQSHPQAAQWPLLANLVQTMTDDTVLEQTPSPGTNSIRDQLLATRPQERATLLESYVQEQLAFVLKMPPERIDRQATTRSLGVDSLMSLEIRRRLEMGLDISLSSTIVWNYPTVEKMASHLAHKLDIFPKAEVSPEPAPKTAETSADVDEDLLAILAELDNLPESKWG